MSKTIRQRASDLEKKRKDSDKSLGSDNDLENLVISQECYRKYGMKLKKVELAAKSRAELLQTLSDANVEISNLIASLGDKSYKSIPDKTSGTIKEQLSAIAPALEQLWQQKEKRVQEFSGVQSQIQKICEEIAGGLSNGPLVVDESDLSLKRLDEYKSKLQELHKEKSDRLNKVLEFVITVHDLCAVLGLDFLSTVTEVHPSLAEVYVQNKSISNETLLRLVETVLTLKEDKNQRLKKLQELAAQLTDLWNLMDTPDEKKQPFDHVTCNMSASVHEVTVSGALALDLIAQAEVEVDRLDKLKASRMKEIAFKKQTKLEEIYARAHIEIKPEVVRERIMSLVDSGNTEPAELLAQMDSEIAKAKEEAFSRKEILDRVEKWMSACEEESWLEDYNLNRYNASRGAHLNLKRAEKARILVSKITAIVDTLVAKTWAWEEDKGMSFEYDGVPLLAVLDEYTILRQEREEEKRRQKPHTEQDSAFGSKPNPARPISAKKHVGTSLTIRRLSMNGNKSKRDSFNKPTSPSNLGAVAKKDAAASSVVASS
ncbi:65-kDa microtubule-associated protein 2 [Hirschfeldia incana]|nr:65-kDa microtubule-associated protein 2 [Hirschfeldia incana]